MSGLEDESGPLYDGYLGPEGATGSYVSGNTARNHDGNHGKPMKGEQNRDVRNDAAAVLFQDPISHPADALRMLVDAASRTETGDRGENTDSDGARQRSQSGHEASRGMPIISGASILSPAIDPAIVGMQDAGAQPDANEMQAALHAWSALRFVRAGWFTPREAINFVCYFYEHINPLTPISPPDFSALSTHAKLLNEEPMLTVTILMIASRYMKLDGPGAQSRSFKIHDKLWEYLQGMITRMFWGQEQFGGGFCGAGGSKTLEEVETRRRGMRSLGTVERYDLPREELV